MIKQNLAKVLFDGFFEAYNKIAKTFLYEIHNIYNIYSFSANPTLFFYLSLLYSCHKTIYMYYRKKYKLKIILPHSNNHLIDFSIYIFKK